MQSDLTVRAGQIRHLPEIPAVDAPRVLAAKWARRSRRPGMRCHDKIVALLDNAFDYQPLGHVV